MFCFELIETIIIRNGFYLISKDTLDEFEKELSIMWNEFLKRGMMVYKCNFEEHFIVSYR